MPCRAGCCRGTQGAEEAARSPSCRQRHGWLREKERESSAHPRPTEQQGSSQQVPPEVLSGSSSVCSPIHLVSLGRVRPCGSLSGAHAESKVVPLQGPWVDPEGDDFPPPFPGRESLGGGDGKIQAGRIPTTAATDHQERERLSPEVEMHLVSFRDII